MLRGMTRRQTTRRRLSVLEAHLRAEIPDLLPVFGACRGFDRVSHRLGLLARDESLTTDVPWWPVVAALGAAASGKAAFLDALRPADGGRPVDGAPAVLCYGEAASDADPRIAADLGDGLRVEGSGSERMRGRVLVDTPGEAVQPADRIVGLSDLVLVFPPEPEGVMPVLSKAARGADARRVFTVRSDADLAAVDARVAAAGVEHGRRLVQRIDSLAQELEDEVIPFLKAALARWRSGVWTGGAVWLGILALVLGGAVFLGGTENLPAFGDWLFGLRPARIGGLPLRLLALAAGVGGLWLAGHLWVRRWVAARLAAGLPERMGEAGLNVRRAFLRNTRFPRPAIGTGVAGWGRRTQRRLAAMREAMREHARNPGEGAPDAAAATAQTGD